MHLCIFDILLLFLSCYLENPLIFKWQPHILWYGSAKTEISNLSISFKAYVAVVVVQLLSHVWLFCDSMDCRKSVLNIHWKDWCWSWSSNTLATWCKELTLWKRPWCWERLKVGGEGDDRGWDGWMASPTQWTWVWVNSGSWWWTGRPGLLQSVGSQRDGHNWVTELMDCSPLGSSVHGILQARILSG